MCVLLIQFNVQTITVRLVSLLCRQAFDRKQPRYSLTYRAIDDDIVKEYVKVAKLVGD